MSLLRTAVAGASRSALAARSSLVPLRHFATSNTRLAEDNQQRDPQLGDYPDLPFVSLQQRKYSPEWWDPQEKRNFGETLHEQDDILGVWAPDVYEMNPYSALRQFLLAAGLIGVGIFGIYLSTPERVALPRTYPRDGLGTELGGPQAAARAEGCFAASDDEKEEEDEE